MKRRPDLRAPGVSIISSEITKIFVFFDGACWCIRATALYQYEDDDGSRWHAHVDEHHRGFRSRWEACHLSASLEPRLTWRDRVAPPRLEPWSPELPFAHHLRRAERHQHADYDLSAVGWPSGYNADDEIRLEPQDAPEALH